MTALQPQVISIWKPEVILISSSLEDSGVTIVVSPLITLMQVDALARRNVSDACLDSTKTGDEYLQSWGIRDDILVSAEDAKLFLVTASNCFIRRPPNGLS